MKPKYTVGEVQELHNRYKTIVFDLIDSIDEMLIEHERYSKCDCADEEAHNAIFELNQKILDWKERKKEELSFFNDVNNPS